VVVAPEAAEVVDFHNSFSPEEQVGRPEEMLKLAERQAFNRKRMVGGVVVPAPSNPIFHVNPVPAAGVLTGRVTSVANTPSLDPIPIPPEGQVPPVAAQRASTVLAW